MEIACPIGPYPKAWYNGNMKKRQESFRQWLDRRELTLEAFSRAVPTLHYSTVAKWSMAKKSPHPQDAHRLLIAQVYPDCPLVK